MKVVFLLLILSSFLLSSCGIFGKYGSLSISPGGGWFDMYHSQLSQQDINRLNNGEEVYLKYEVDWPDFKREGELRVLPTVKPNVFNFIEIGVWKSGGEFKFNRFNKGMEKHESVYDSLGNELSMKHFRKQYNQADFVLLEEWKHLTENYDGKVNQLHHVKAYHQNGNIYLDAWYDLPEFGIPKNSGIKKRVPVKYRKNYNKAGVLKKEILYDMNGNVIEKRKG